jgi:hypothetical protein
MRVRATVAAVLGAVTLIALTATGAVAHGDGQTGDRTGDQTGNQQGRALPVGAQARLSHLRHELSRYRDPAVAVADGYLPSDSCVELPGVGGMGYHFINPALLGTVDPDHPSILVYVPARDGGLTLGAAEWFHADADQDLSTDGDKPSLFGIPFDGPMPGHEPGMPIHDDLHAWLFVPNPAGIVEPWNPQVHCP